MKGAFKQNVSPKIVAIAVLITLATIQWWWWQALVAKRSTGSGPGGASQGGPGRPMVLYIAGRPDVDVETLAGIPEPGLADGPGYVARFDGPTGIVLEDSGALLVADTRNHRIRRVTPQGLTTTISGGDRGFKDGPIGTALFDAPSGIRKHSDGSLLVLDAGNRRIRRLSAESVSTLAEFKTPLEALHKFNESDPRITASVNRPEGDTGSENMSLTSLQVTAKLGEAFAASDNKHSVIFYILNGSAEVIAGLYTSTHRMDGWLDGKGDKSRFGRIGGIVAANENTIYVADTSNNCIRRITVPEGG